MAKLNGPNIRYAPTSPLLTAWTPTAINHRGGDGYVRDPQTEVYLLGLSNFVSEEDNQEGTLSRDDRWVNLVRGVALNDPDWTSRLLVYLRNDRHMRTGPLVGAAEFIRARQEAGIHDDCHSTRERGIGRRTVDLVCQRADEVTDMGAYWIANYGKRMPMALKKGLADAANRLYNAKGILAHDSARNAVRFGDIIELIHPKPVTSLRSDAFRYAIDRRHNRDDPHVGDLRILRARAELMAVPLEERRAVVLAPNAATRMLAARMTWKSLAGWLQSEMDAAAWAAILPSMGYMALLRNLRNFDRKGLPNDLAHWVTHKLTDPAEVARSRQMPLRFLSAYRAVTSDRWGWALEQALELSLSNITGLPGNTLVLVDTSASMDAKLSEKSELKRWDAAVMFGLAVARRCANADVVSFSNGYHRTAAHRRFEPVGGESLLRSLQRWENEGFFINGGTDTVGALKANYKWHDRVLILTDEQAEVDPETVSSCVPKDVPMYTWNLGGYRYGHAPSGRGNRHVFGGLTDGAFGLIPILERGEDAGWPF